MGKLPASNYIIAIVALLILGVPLLHSLADTASSTDFMVNDGFVGLFGGEASSTDFEVISGGAPIVNGGVTSTDFESNTGPVNYGDYAPVSQTWRWYGDANDETPTSSLAAENTAPSNIGD